MPTETGEAVPEKKLYRGVDALENRDRTGAEAQAAGGAFL